MADPEPAPAPTAASVAVIGAGPRGISVLERLIAARDLRGDLPVTVHLVDPAPIGGGRVWRHDQPAHLLMNTLCADATHFTDDTVTCEGPIVPGPTLFQWCRQVAAGEVRLGPGDAPIVAEASRIEPHGHPSRRLLGRYLRWCYDADLARADAGLRVVEHRLAAVDVIPSQAGPTTVRLSDGSSLEVDAVVLATGHADRDLTPGERQRVDHVRRHGLFYGRPTNPIDADLSDIAAGEPVIVRGLGMNFFDYLSLLTVGRGGRFEPADEDGRLRYRPTGTEPVLLVGSRRGTPYRAKGVFGRMTPRFPPRYLTTEVVDRLADRGAISFRHELWPLIAKDTLRVYYTVLAEHEPEAFAGPPARDAAAAVLDALDAHDWDSPELTRVITEAVPQPEHRADLAGWDQPLHGSRFDSADDFAGWWLADLRRDLAEARRGLASALKCASVALGQGRTPLRRLVRYGGLLGHSYDVDVDRWFKGYAGSLASGPPASRIAELIALTEAGLVRPVGPAMAVSEVPGGFAARSAQVEGSEVVARALLEAHLPPADLARSADPLLARLHRTGRARPYQIPDRDRPPFASGALEVGPPPYRVVAADGREHARLYAVGVPVEGLHYGTQLGPLAGTDSQFLRETDAVARAMLRDCLAAAARG